MRSIHKANLRCYLFQTAALSQPTYAKVLYSRRLDLLTTAGFLASFAACRRLVRGGLAFIGVPCGSWVWISRGSTKRCRLRPRGNKKYRKVRETNRLVRRLLYLLLDHIVNFDHIWFKSLVIFSQFTRLAAPAKMRNVIHYPPWIPMLHNHWGSSIYARRMCGGWSSNRAQAFSHFTSQRRFRGHVWKHNCFISILGSRLEVQVFHIYLFYVWS